VLEDDSGFLGLNKMRWADQHIHRVDGFGNDWFMGTDMAKVYIQTADGTPLGACWACVLDTETNRCDATLLVVLSDKTEGDVDRLVQKHNKQQPAAPFADLLRDLSALFRAHKQHWPSGYDEHLLRLARVRPKT